MELYGNIPSGWHLKKVKEVSVTYSGGTPPRADESFYHGNIPWVKSSELKEKYLYDTEEKINEKAIRNSSTRYVEADTVLFALYGATSGDMTILKIKACMNQAVLCIPIIEKKKYNTEFLFYALKFLTPKLIEISQGGGQPNLTKGIIDKTKILFPKKAEEQQYIADILTKVDEAITTTKETIAKAERLKKSLVQNLLSGKLKADGSWRKEKEFYKDEKFGNTPIGWHWGRLSEIADVIAGQSPAGEFYNDEGKGIPMLNGPTEFTDHHPIPVQYTTKRTKLCEVGDILFTVRGSSTGRMNIADQQYCIGRGIAAIRNKKGSDIDFIYYTLITIAEKILAEARGSGTTFPNVNRGELLKKSVLIPESEQEEIAKKIKSVDAILNSKQTKIKKLERLKKALMQNLLTGKVRVKIQKLQTQ